LELLGKQHLILIKAEDLEDVAEVRLAAMALLAE